MAIDLSGIAEWLHGWFPYHTEVVAKNQTSANASKNVVTDSSGEVTTENKISVGSNSGLSMSNANVLSHSNSVTGGELTTATLKKIKYDGQGHITGTANVESSDLPSHTHEATDVEDVDFVSYTHINPINGWQSNINEAIDTAIGDLQSIKAIEVVSTKPTASADTMNKLYIVSENSKINVYYTVTDGQVFEWNKMDADILDELVVNWSDVQNKPSTFTPSSHSHGNLTNDGKIGNNADKLIITGTGGTLIPVSYIEGTQILDTNAHSNIGSSANATQETINSAIDTALGNKASASHTHGQISNDGKLTTSVTVASGDSIVVTDLSDSNKIKRVENVLASHIKDSTAHSNIGSSANDLQSSINSKIDTALGNKASASHTHGNITNDGKLTNADTGTYTYFLTTDSNDAIVKARHLHSYTVSNDDALSNIGTSANASQEAINTAIDTAIGNHDTAISGKAPTSHSHGNVTSDGKIGSNTDSGKIVTTTTNGALAVSSDLSTNVIKDPNGHMAIDTIVNDTQSTINSKIASAISSLRGELSDISRVIYTNTPSIPDDNHSNYGYSEIFITTDTGHTCVYYWNAITTPGVLGIRYELECFELSNVGESITSIELVPKSSDSTGAIRLYYGDET